MATSAVMDTANVLLSVPGAILTLYGTQTWMLEKAGRLTEAVEIWGGVPVTDKTVMLATNKRHHCFESKAIKTVVEV
jgi:hypothetical protein